MNSIKHLRYSMKQKLLLSFVVALLLFSGALPLQAFDLRHSRDSLESLLQKVPEDNGRRRLELLNHLCDIDLSLGDTTYIYPCWQAAVRMHDVNSMDDLLIPLTMRAMRRGQADSVKVWQERCRQYFDGPLSECNLEYLQMMQDLRDWENHDKLSQRMINEEVKLDAEQKPYQAMRILYTLGILSSFEKSGNAKTTLKTFKQALSNSLKTNTQLTLTLTIGDLFSEENTGGVTVDSWEVESESIDIPSIN